VRPAEVRDLAHFVEVTHARRLQDVLHRDCLRYLSYRGAKCPIYSGGAMKIISKLALAAVTTAGLAFATSAPAAAQVTDHQHCLLTPDGWVRIATGVSEVAPEEPALENFHEHVHLGEPGEHLTIVRIPVGGECPPDPAEVAASED
jgi:hypothetical protein